MTTQSKTLTVLFILVFAYIMYYSQNSKQTPKVISNIMPATFTWETEPSNAVNGDGQPKTNVYVKAVYANGVVEKKLIDVESGCNELPSPEKDGAVFQCYLAGAGYKYKIVKGISSYEIQRRTFEEALPKQKQKVFEYETVVEFKPAK